MPRGTLELPEDIARDLTARLGATTEEDTSRGMFFLGVLDAVRFLGGEEAVARVLEQAGEKADYVPTQPYPFPRFLRLSYAAAWQLAPQVGDFDSAMRQIGTQAMLDFLHSMFAREVVQQAGGDPKRLMELMQAGYRMALNFGERTVEWKSPTSGRITMTRTLMPVPYTEGILRAALEVTGVHDVQVQGRSLALVEAVYDIAWS
ncbi:TIGR02265 family protein [Corallococcus llansteffanensis]|uniref:TIGR02265 family protein n=1 Tax=Corallococcus llansteffanensis TaxID=2316731 RepID=A0A3A8NJV8_9BACT|nr:TIGR02265 family protein [Corallococcus llansteffanensis]RKH41475.1 TIGR02265 family protein [Corallococcus llansteffanensis]